MIDFDLDALIESSVNAAQLVVGIDPRVVQARSGIPVPVAALHDGNVNRRITVWTEEEDAFLRANLGILSEEDIAARLGRTVDAVKIRWPRKGYHAPSKQPGDIVARRVGDMLGMCGKKVKRLINMDVMPARTIPGKRRIMVINRYQLLRWCVQPQNWIYLKVHRIKDRRIKRLVEVRQARWDDEWWSTGQVAKYHGCDHRVVNRRIHEGRLPAVKWDNWYVLKSDALKQRFYHGKGKNLLLDWSRDGDAFLVLASAVGVPAECIDDLRSEPTKRSRYRLGLLIKRRKIRPLTLAYGLPLQQRRGLLFCDWREVSGRFPGLVRAAKRLLNGRTLSFKDRQYLRGVMRAWAEWYGLESLSHRLKWAQAAKSEGLRAFYDEMLAAGIDPFEGVL